MIKRTAMIVLSILTVTIPLFPLSASASTTIPGDASQVGYVLNADQGAHLTDSEWCNAQGKHLSWPTALATCNVGGGTVPFFDKANSSYVIFRDLEVSPPLTDGNGHTLKTNRFTMYIASPNHKMTFYKNATDNQYYITSDSIIYKAQLTAEPNSDPDYKYNWTGSYTANQYYSQSAITFDPNAISGFKGMVIGNDVQAGQVGAVNTNYASSWDMAQFTNHVPYGEDGQANCGTLDIGCWVGKLTKGFTNVVSGIFGLLVDAFKWMFVPDGSAIKSSFDDMTTQLTNKLGFLAYPFTFIGNLFTAFTGSNSWCNDTYCAKDFGNLYGHDFTVNLGQMATTMPSIWTWFIGFVRGLTILGLLFAVRSKYRQVATR